jgi:hypothetical protein
MMTTSIKIRLKQILSANQTGVLIIISGVIGRLIQIFYFFNIRVDASYQTIATKNFVAGRGITIDSVLSSDLSTIIYEPLVKWPPGFSLLLTPFYLLSGGNYIIAGILLHSVCAIALIIFARAILRLFEVPLYLINTYTPVVSFFIYSFYSIISSDAIATCFFVAGLYYTFSFLKTQQHSTKKTIAASVCFLVCAFTKYLLIPVVFVVPAYLVAKGYFTKDRRIKRSGVISFLILLMAVTSLFLYQKQLSGSAAYVSPMEHGFFPQNLPNAYPVFPAGFLNPDTLSLLSGSASVHNLIFHVYQLIYLLAIVALGYGLFNFFKTFSATKPLRKLYFQLFLLVSIALVGALAVLSVLIAKGEETPGRLWTYIQEPRYYGPLVVLMQLLFFIFYPIERYKTKWLFQSLFLLLSIETCRGIAFDINRIRLIDKEEYSWHYEDRFQKYADSILKTAEAKFSIERVAVTGSSYFMNNRVSLYSHAPVLSAVKALNKPSLLNAQKPVLLLVIIHQKDFSSFQPFLSAQKEIAGKFNEFYFYTVYVQPH